MILRKPYAILIKNFKLIHFIMALMIGFLFYKTSSILSFLNDYLSSVATTITHEVTSSLFSPLFVLIIILIIMASLIILALMKFKDKPIKFYIYNIITCILLAIFYYVSYSIIKSLESGLVDIRTLKMIHDLALVALVIQGIDFAIVLIRATGFDIKSFDFKRDLEELNIEAKDNEEFEVDVEFDSNKLKRTFNKKIRHFKYAYFENKLLINLFMVVIIFIVSLVLFLNFKVYNRIYKLNEQVNTNEYAINFMDSFNIKYNRQNKIIKKDYELVVVKFKIKKLYNAEKVLNRGNIYLDINGYKYYHTLKYKDSLIDFGKTYNNQKIDNDYNNYIFAFLVPESKIGQTMVLTYADTDKKKFKIDVTPTSLNEQTSIRNASLNEKLDFSGSILNNSSLIINNYEIANEFNLDYNVCIKDECYDYIEKLKAKATNNEKTVLLKLSGNLELEESNSKIDNIYKFIKYFGKIKYEKNNITKEMKTILIEVKPNKAKTNDFYMEVSHELMEADKIYVEFNIRNKLYVYNLK